MKLLCNFSGIFILLFLLQNIFGQELPTGSIQGQILDAETQTPLAGANIIVENTIYGAASDLAGNFNIPKIPVGTYVIRIQYIGYKSLMKPDIIVKSGRITQVMTKLEMAALETEAITVTAGYFTESDNQPVSAVNFSYEEIRRAPGSAGDVSRILMSLPSVAKVNDQSNQLIVRGGNPVENTFFVDNIEIPNINHFPDQGTSSGPIGLINVDFIQDVNFYTGGFSSVYGDKLSAVMDMSFREGNRQEFDGQFDFNMAGFGGVFESPLGQKGSWMISARRSYLDLVVDMFEVGSTVAPRYGDYQGKVVYDLNPSHKLMFLGIFGDDHNNPDRETGLENQMSHYGNQDVYFRTLGMNWRALWGKSGYSNTSFSWTSQKYDEDFYRTSTGAHEIMNNACEQSWKFRNVNHLRLNTHHSLEFGLDVKHLVSDFNNFYADSTGSYGEIVGAVQIKDDIEADKAGTFMNWIWQPHPEWTTTLGCRTDYFSHNDGWTVSPRMSVSFQMTERTSSSASAGLFHQNLPLLLLAQMKNGKALQNPEAMHFIFGIEHLLTADTRLTLEGYYKKYDHFPLDKNQPLLFPIDEKYIQNFGEMTDEGKAKSWGVEVMIQKKLAKNIYGLMSASWFRSQYLDGTNTWRNRRFDNRFVFSAEGGYKPGRSWEFSLRWIYAGGAPMTPVDEALSALVRQTVFDDSKIYSERYPDYHSLNLRVDRRFNFKRTNLILYLSAWNAYNQKNIAEYYWNDEEQKTDKIYQWLMLPIFGVEYEF